MSASASGSVEGVRWDPSSGDLTFEFWSKQRELLDAANSGEFDIVAGLGGYGSGKSISGARWLITNALAEAGSKHLAMAIDYIKGYETTFEVLFKQLPGEGTEIFTSNVNGPERSPIVKDFNRKRNRITFINDSVILLGSADYPGRHAGDEFGSIWLDEPSHYHPNEKLYYIGLEMLPTRLRSHDRILCQLWTLTGNGYNSAWRILDQREDEDGEEVGQRIEIVQLPTHLNPYLDERTRERFSNQYAGTERELQALEGGFSASKGLVYEPSRVHHIISLEWFEEEIEEDGETKTVRHPAARINGRTVPIEQTYRVYGYDAGWVDPRVCLEIGRTVGDAKLVVIDEWYREQTHIEVLIDQWLTGKIPGVIACEHELDDIEKLRSKTRHHPIEANKKSIDDGISEVSQLLNPRDPDSGERLPPEHIRLYVNEECEHTIRELFDYKEDEIGASNAEDHAMDSLRYAIKAIADGEDSMGIGFGTLEMG